MKGTTSWKLGVQSESEPGPNSEQLSGDFDYIWPSRNRGKDRKPLQGCFIQNTAFRGSYVSLSVTSRATADLFTARAGGKIELKDGDESKTRQENRAVSRLHTVLHIQEKTVPY